jgi:hypothetical protein
VCCSWRQRSCSSGSSCCNAGSSCQASAGRARTEPMGLWWAWGGAQTHRVFDTDLMCVARGACSIRGPMVAFLVLPAAAVVATGGCITWGSRRPVGYAMLRGVSGCAGVGEVGVAGAHVSMFSRIRGVCVFLVSDCAGTDTTFPTECRMLCEWLGCLNPRHLPNSQRGPAWFLHTYLAVTQPMPPCSSCHNCITGTAFVFWACHVAAEPAVCLGSLF